MHSIPLEITFRHLDASPALEARINELIQGLTKFSSRILRGHVVVDNAHRDHPKGFSVEFHVRVSMPEKEIYVRRAALKGSKEHDPYVVLGNAVDAARRQIQDYERKRRGGVKRPVSVPLQ